MRLPLSWIKEFINIDRDGVAVGDLLTSLGLEVDAIEPEDFTFSGVVVGQIETISPHPNAERLVLLKVFDGKERHQVVCGARNCREGGKYPFAREGAYLTDEKGEKFELKRTKIRGVESCGMMCSGDELRLEDDTGGIMELPDSAPVGQDVKELFHDSIFEISLTPNMGHNLSLMGVVRELSATTGLPITSPEVVVNEEGVSIEGKVSVDLHDQKSCPRYTCRLIENVNVGPSPIWLQRRLKACGIRSINNVVDITNYVMIEMGQPLHSFDFDKLVGGTVVVRRANPGEKIVTLDGKERILGEEILVIADKEKPVALAGIMGTESSGVSNDTKRVLLESAYFDMGAIRRGSKKLGLSTDSSKRFERGVDFEGVVKALDRAAMLIEEVCGAKPLKGIIDKGAAYWEPKMVECRLSRIEQILGFHISLDEVETILSRLLFQYRWDGKNLFTITVPSWRHDVNHEIDIIEEVARIWGYDNIPKAGGRYMGSHTGHAPIFLLEREMRSRLLSEGLQEFVTCDLLSKEQAERIANTEEGKKSLISVLNPVSEEHAVLRPSLIPGLLAVVKHNWDFQNQNINGFEVGRIHYKVGDQYKEQTTGAVVLSGRRAPHHWDGTDAEADFFELKGIVENVFDEMHLEGYQFLPSDQSIFHTGRRAKIVAFGQEIGVIGEIHPEVLRKLGIPQRIYIAEWNLHDLHRFRKTKEQMKPLAEYPSIDRDWTITLREATPIQEVLAIIQAIESPYLEEVTLKDLYRSEKVGEKRKNVTIHFVYRDRKRTLSQEEVDLEHARVTELALESLTQFK